MSVAPATATGEAPGLVATLDEREQVLNFTFGGAIMNVSKTEAFVDDTAAYMFDPLGLITYSRVLCAICCGNSCPIKYNNDKSSYEYSMMSKCCCCCRCAWMEAHKGSSADDNIVPLAYTMRHEGCCYCGKENWAIGDMLPDAASPGDYIKGPIAYGIRNKPDCCKVGCCACWKIEKENCSQLIDGNIIMTTHMPIYRNPNPNPQSDGFGTKSDWEARSEVIGAMSVQNLLVPCFCCCAVPGGCPLNTQISVKKEFAATMSDDEKIKLGLFAMSPMPMVPTPGANFDPSMMPLPMHWLSVQALSVVGYVFGFGSTNAEVSYASLKGAFGNGMADTGDLIPKIMDGIKKK
jgi:hypothetical protein